MSTDGMSTPLMVLGTSSGAGKSLMSAALCRLLLRRGETPIPFKGQNMSNNAWVDESGGEMAYSQALQAWAAGLEPQCAMNPVLLKPQGDSTSEVIHLGQSVGTARAETYYEQWFRPGWSVIREALKDLQCSYTHGRLVLEGAGSPVEVNLQRRDLTNLRLAQFLRARCLLVADIERGGVFAQIIGTLSLLKPVEKQLIRGLLINRFRGRRELFDEGRHWLEAKTGIPVIGVMPWLEELFPPEDSLDLLERRGKRNDAEIEIAVLKLPSLSNFSDLDPLEAEPTVQLRWVEPGTFLGTPDAVIIPGSKQTLRDLKLIKRSDLGRQLQTYAQSGGHVLGICGGMQMLGRTLADPLGLEGVTTTDPSSSMAGLNLLPLDTVFKRSKALKQCQRITQWPDNAKVKGFELHHGNSQLIQGSNESVLPMADDPSLGWVSKNERCGQIAGTYLHGIFENGRWRRLWLNLIRKQKGLADLPTDIPHHGQQREKLLNRLADVFEEHVNINSLLEK